MKVRFNQKIDQCKEKDESFSALMILSPFFNDDLVIYYRYVHLPKFPEICSTLHKSYSQNRNTSHHKINYVFDWYIQYFVAVFGALSTLARNRRTIDTGKIGSFSFIDDIKLSCVLEPKKTFQVSYAAVGWKFTLCFLQRQATHPSEFILQFSALTGILTIACFVSKTSASGHKAW